MSDWQPGDLALCVNDTPDPDHGKPFVRGAVYRVAAIERVRRGWSKTFGWFRDAYGLQFVGMNIPVPADPRRFRKIRPHTPDAEDAETIRLLTGKPVPEPAQ